MYSVYLKTEDCITKRREHKIIILKIATLKLHLLICKGEENAEQS